MRPSTVAADSLSCHSSWILMQSTRVCKILPAVTRQRRKDYWHWFEIISIYALPAQRYTAETAYYWVGDEADLVLDCKGIRVVDMTISIVHCRGRRGNRNQTTYFIDEDELHQLKLSVGNFESLHEPRWVKHLNFDLWDERMRRRRTKHSKQVKVTCCGQ